MSIQDALQNDEWPTLAQELQRKGVAVLDSMMQRHDDGKISSRELYLICSVLWDQTSGLAPEPYLRLLEAVMKDLKGKKKRGS